MPGTHYRVLDDGRDRTRWLERRRAGIGASDVPAVFNLSSWGSRMSVYTDKLAIGEPMRGNPATAFGREFEPILLDHFGRATGRIVRSDGRLLQSRRYPFLLCTLDARQWDADGVLLGAVEGKTTLDNWERDGLPASVHLQVQAQYIVTRFRRITVAVFNRFSAQYGHLEVPPDPEVQIEIIRECERFYREHLLAEVPPDVDPSAACRRAIARLYPEHKVGKIAKLGFEQVRQVERMQRLEAAIARLGEQRDELSNALRMAVGEAEYARLPDGSGFSYRLEGRGARVLRRTDDLDKTIERREKQRTRAEAKASAAA